MKPPRTIAPPGIRLVRSGPLELASSLQARTDAKGICAKAMQHIDPAPLWDEGISTFLHGEYERTGQPLTIADLQRFAGEHAVRVGDILETLFLMAIYGEWLYADENGDEQHLDEAALDNLYARGRLSEADMAAFSGVWSPVEKR